MLTHKKGKRISLPANDNFAEWKWNSFFKFLSPTKFIKEGQSTQSDAFFKTLSFHINKETSKPLCQ